MEGTVGGSGSALLNNTSDHWSVLDTRHCYIEGRLFDCLRTAVLLVLGAGTGVVCLLRLLQYHCYRARNYHQYIIYYAALLICLLSVIHWGYVWSPILDIVNTYLIVIQMLVISWFFCSWAFRILQREKLFTCLVVPILLCVGVYFSGCLIWACVRTSVATRECAEPQWLLFSSSLLVLVQFFVLSVLYITKKLNDIRTMKTNRFSQKAQLWGLAVMYEVISMAAFAYDIYLLLTKSVDGQCGIDFSSHGMGVAIAIMFVIHKVVKYLIPQLVISIVFAPLKARPIKFQHELGETDTLSWADKPEYKSIFFKSSEGSPLSNQTNPNSTSFPHLINSSTTPVLPQKTSDSSKHTSPFVLPSQTWRTNAPNLPKNVKPLPSYS